MPGRTAWEHAALARLYMRRDHVESAAAHARQAVALDPQGLWPNFYLGHCAFRLGQFADATVAFSVCIGASPDAACFYNRGRSYAALNDLDRALADYDEALRRDPRVGAALVNRGLLLIRNGNFSGAKRDLQQACGLGENARLPLTVLQFLEIGQSLARAGFWESVEQFVNGRIIRSK
jgi:tetratricopeptide (TPR) repeat protein